MPKCLNCEESYADSLRRCPHCGAAPDLGAGSGLRPVLPGRSAPPAPVEEPARSARLAMLPVGLALLALLGVVAFVVVRRASKGASTDEATMAGTGHSAPREAAPLPGHGPDPLQPPPPGEGLEVVSVEVLGGLARVHGRCSPKGIARVTVDGMPAVLSPNADSFEAEVPVRGGRLKIVADGIDGLSASIDAEVPAAPPVQPPPALQVRNLAEGETVQGNSAHLEIASPGSAAPPRTAEVDLHAIENRIPLGERTFTLFRAPPGFAFLRVTPKGQRSFLRIVDRQEMILVPAGIARRGTGQDPPMGPEQLVKMRPFLIDRTEVTCRQYSSFLQHMRRSNDPSLRHPEDPGGSLIPRRWDGEEPPDEMLDLPVTGVTWYAAYAYARWVGGRLASEAEWERAMSGPFSTPYPWGVALDSGRCRQGEQGPLPADSLPEGESLYSVLHGSGNVREWCLDRFDPRWLLRAPRFHPMGPTGGTHRVVRGGSYATPADWLRLQVRDHASPLEAAEDLGFRVARDWVD